MAQKKEETKWLVLEFLDHAVPHVKGEIATFTEKDAKFYLQPEDHDGKALEPLAKVVKEMSHKEYTDIQEKQAQESHEQRMIENKQLMANLNISTNATQPEDQI